MFKTVLTLYPGELKKIPAQCLLYVKNMPHLQNMSSALWSTLISSIFKNQDKIQISFSEYLLSEATHEKVWLCAIKLEFDNSF